MPTRTNLLRPTLDSLEPREVCWAGLPGLPLGSLSPIVHLGPVGPPSHRLPVADAVFSLVNRTSNSITFSVQWQGASETTSYTLMPGQSRAIWTREVERFWMQTAVIHVDGGRGIYSVKAGLTGDGSKGPIGSGPVFTFQPGPGGGVSLQSATSNVSAANKL